MYYVFILTNEIVCTQDIAIGLNLYLGSQSICIVGFGFPTKGDPYAWKPRDTPVSTNPSLYLTKSLSFFLRMVALFSPYSL